MKCYLKKTYFPKPEPLLELWVGTEKCDVDLDFAFSFGIGNSAATALVVPPCTCCFLGSELIQDLKNRDTLQMLKGISRHDKNSHKLNKLLGNANFLSEIYA